MIGIERERDETGQITQRLGKTEATKENEEAA
jgi:hypothetical protein